MPPRILDAAVTDQIEEQKHRLGHRTFRELPGQFDACRFFPLAQICDRENVECDLLRLRNRGSDVALLESAITSGNYPDGRATEDSRPWPCRGPGTRHDLFRVVRGRGEDEREVALL